MDVIKDDQVTKYLYNLPSIVEEAGGQLEHICAEIMK